MSFYYFIFDYTLQFVCCILQRGSYSMCACVCEPAAHLRHIRIKQTKQNNNNKTKYERKKGLVAIFRANANNWILSFSFPVYASSSGIKKSSVSASNNMIIIIFFVCMLKCSFVAFYSMAHALTYKYTYGVVWCWNKWRRIAWTNIEGRMNVLLYFATSSKFNMVLWFASSGSRGWRARKST